MGSLKRIFLTAGVLVSVLLGTVILLDLQDIKAGPWPSLVGMLAAWITWKNTEST